MAVTAPRRRAKRGSACYEPNEPYETYGPYETYETYGPMGPKRGRSVRPAVGLG